MASRGHVLSRQCPVPLPVLVHHSRESQADECSTLLFLQGQRFLDLGTDAVSAVPPPRPGDSAGLLIT
jgi:hypothetical protein